jgi:uncharacterized YigZ family protein
MEDRYFSTVECESHFEIKIKNSVFISHLNNVETFEDAKKYISKINIDYKDATHNCWGYIIGKSAENFHSSDAGEPSGTAGKPILNTLQKYNTTNIVAVVTRYYGGVKLGVRGLIDAYSESVEEGLKNSKLIKIVELQNYKINLSYDKFETVKYNLISMGVEVKDIEYTDSIKLIGEIEKNKASKSESYLIELKNSGQLDFEII